MLEDEGFEVIDGDLPIRQNPESSASTIVDQDNSNNAQIALHPIPDQKALLVSVNPPTKPQKDIPHVPCDVVLVIDVSGSMSAAAPLPPESESGQHEESGLTVLDLTKHAARTIIETLNENDRLGVVTFSNDARTWYELAPMTKENKTAVLEEIEKLCPQSLTNLWHGLKLGLQTLADASPIAENTQSLFILTDGLPNSMCPKQGYVPKLRPILREQQSKTGKLPVINTFGFGYSIRSGLLESISEVGNGNFAFIPDAGMLGTVFVHAIANLYTTYATGSKLTVRGGQSLKLSVGEGLDMGLQLDEAGSNSSELSLNLKTLHYGQSRDILLNYETVLPGDDEIEVTVSYDRQGSLEKVAPRKVRLSERTSLPSSVYDYHRFRSRICVLLRSLYTLRPDGEYGAVEDPERPKKALDELIRDIEKAGHTDEQNVSLHQDLAGEDPHGQVRTALSVSGHYDKWGKHYLLSLLNAHTHQICNSFKDPGPLQYGKDSPFFCRCRQELDDCFDNLPPPKPTARQRTSHDGHSPHASGHAASPKFSMSRFRRSSAPCFAGHCAVRLPGYGDSIAVKDVRAGMNVWTPCGPRSVKAVVATSVRDTALCKIGSLYVTPWHPIMVNDGTGDDRVVWAFPNEVPHESVPFTGPVYSVLLEPDSSSDAHAISVGGHVCVTLGHGVTAGKDDVRAHEFLGDYARVLGSLRALRHDSRGVLRASGVKRHPVTGLTCSFTGAEQACPLPLVKRSGVSVRRKENGCVCFTTRETRRPPVVLV